MSPENVDNDKPVTPASGFRFINLMVHHASFQEVSEIAPEQGEQRPLKPPITIQVKAQAQISTELQAIVSLDVTVLPEPKWLPYVCRVVLSGVFAGDGVTDEQFRRFCHHNVPVILFPYVRETIHRLTMDARCGSLKVDPINIQAMLGTVDWEEVPPANSASIAPSEP